MNYDRFIQSLTNDFHPKGITDLLTALWWEKKGDWHKAHIITQEIHTNNAYLIHAYLHRREGDLSNAKLLVPNRRSISIYWRFKQRMGNSCKKTFMIEIYPILE